MDTDLDTRAPTLDMVRDAEHALAGVTRVTPLLENPDLEAPGLGRLLIKNEGMQRTGAFKVRGAYTRIRSLSEDEKSRGVIAYSSGNHAQGVALAARLLGTSAMIVMPADAPAAKIESTRALGAIVETYERDREDSDAVVARLRAETGRVPVPPSGDVRVLAGAATVATELLRQTEQRGARLDAVLVPCGGGGLTAATAFVMDALSPGTEVYAVEPVAFDDTRRSLEAGRRVRNPPARRTICDAIMTPTPNEMTFDINRRLLAGGLAVGDDEVRDAMLFAFHHFKIVVEPGAAVAIAAVLGGKLETAGRTVAAVVTGANIDHRRFAALLADAGGCTRTSV